MNFKINSIPPKGLDEEAVWFLIQNSKLVIKRANDEVKFPTAREIGSIKDRLTNKYYIGSIDDLPCYTASYPSDLMLSDEFQLGDLRKIFGQIDDSLFSAAGRGLQIINWDETHKFCGSCGTPTTIKVDEYAKVCLKCGLTCFPRISPAVIVAITRGNQILLAKNKHFTANFYSVIAGFVEAGETLEKCLRREVREEVGIEVKNINYFGSQPWPFPHSLMIGFTAEFDQGDIKIGENELSDAAWFSVDNLPRIPHKVSIARQLIDWYIEKNK